MPPFQKKKQTDAPQMQQPYLHRFREDFVLFAAGFKRTEHGFLWEKEGVCYGRKQRFRKLGRSCTALRSAPEEPV